MGRIHKHVAVVIACVLMALAAIIGIAECQSAEADLGANAAARPGGGTVDGGSGGRIGGGADTGAGGGTVGCGSGGRIGGGADAPGIDDPGARRFAGSYKGGGRVAGRGI